MFIANIMNENFSNDLNALQRSISRNVLDGNGSYHQIGSGSESSEMFLPIKPRLLNNIAQTLSAIPSVGPLGVTSIGLFFPNTNGEYRETSKPIIPLNAEGPNLATLLIKITGDQIDLTLKNYERFMKMENWIDDLARYNTYLQKKLFVDFKLFPENNFSILPSGINNFGRRDPLIEYRNGNFTNLSFLPVGYRSE